MESIELKPCPFCGGEARIFHFSSAIRDEVWRAVCDKPFCAQGPDGYTEAEAIAAWNKRSAATYGYKQAAEYWQRMYEEAFAERTCNSIDPIDSNEFFICSNCNFGAGRIEFIPNYCPNCGAKVIE